jgi:hypothetical protein
VKLTFRDAKPDDVPVLAARFEERGRMVYKGTPLVYFERMV